jgi:5-formyltetrahydrofolate cyclo-ligase
MHKLRKRPAVTAALQDLAEQKRALRREAERLRALVPQDRQAKAPLTLAQAGLDFTGLRRGLVVSGFYPCRSEIDTLPLLARLDSEGWVTSLPAVRVERQPLVFRKWAPGEPTVPGVWSIPMPLEDAAEVEPDVLLVPLLAYDAMGHRLGYGGGFYDRTLAALRLRKPITAIGVGYVAQELPQVPHGPMDQKLDYVLTEDGPKKCG